MYHQQHHDSEQNLTKQEIIQLPKPLDQLTATETQRKACIGKIMTYTLKSLTNTYVSKGFEWLLPVALKPKHRPPLARPRCINRETHRSRHLRQTRPHNSQHDRPQTRRLLNRLRETIHPLTKHTHRKSQNAPKQANTSTNSHNSTSKYATAQPKTSSH